MTKLLQSEHAMLEAAISSMAVEGHHLDEPTIARVMARLETSPLRQELLRLAKQPALDPATRWLRLGRHTDTTRRDS